MGRHSARGRRWEHVKALVKRLRNWRCERCGGSGRLEVHHKVPVAKGGAVFALSNLELLCRRCHFGHHKDDRPRNPERDMWTRFISEF